MSKKIEELLSPILVLQYKSDIELVENAMKEYAEYYAKRCLEIAADKAESITDIDKYIYGSIVNRDSILNIQLPEHE